MIKYMLDTNIVIYIIKKKPAPIKEAFKVNEGCMSISSVTLIELIYGAEKSAYPEKNLHVIESFVARLDVFNYDTTAAQHTGQIRAELERSGNPIGAYDQMIAGHARSLGLILVTNNIKEFDKVSGLRIENWCG